MKNYLYWLADTRISVLCFLVFLMLPVAAQPMHSDLVSHQSPQPKDNQAEEKGHMAHDHSRHRMMMQKKGYSRSVESYRVPNVRLTDEGGNKVSLGSLLKEEKPVMLQFIFTTCSTICPVLSATFSRAQEKLSSELAGLRMISISIDPEHDTPERLTEYAKRFEAQSQWRFLTGRLSDVVAVQKAFDAYRGNKMNHIPLTFLRVSPNEQWVRLDGLMSAGELVDEYHEVMHK